MEDRFLEFVWLPTFERTARKLLSDEDRLSIEIQLCEDPTAGELMRRTGGFRKLRCSLPGRGKRGGARVVYLVDHNHDQVFMALAYAKGDKSTLTREEEDELRSIARILLSEGDR